MLRCVAKPAWQAAMAVGFADLATQDDRWGVAGNGMPAIQQRPGQEQAPAQREWAAGNGVPALQLTAWQEASFLRLRHGQACRTGEPGGPFDFVAKPASQAAMAVGAADLATQGKLRCARPIRRRRTFGRTAGGRGNANPTAGGR